MPNSACTIYPLVPFIFSSKLKLTLSAEGLKPLGHMAREPKIKNKIQNPMLSSQCIKVEMVKWKRFHRCKVSAEESSLLPLLHSLTFLTNQYKMKTNIAPSINGDYLPTYLFISLANLSSYLRWSHPPK